MQIVERQCNDITIRVVGDKVIVTFRKYHCDKCQKMRLHEVVITPCCVVCQEYNLNHVAVETNDGANAPLDIWGN